MDGYMGVLLNIDLTHQRATTIEIDVSIAKYYIGGSGYAARLLLDKLSGTIDPLGPDNVLVFMTGPLTGTQAPCSGRHVVCARSPLTGLWGEANAGGHFGAMLKTAGFDGILIEGRAGSPCLIRINDSDIQFEDASMLWGLDTKETQDRIRSEYETQEIACIGPAGENLVRYAGIVNQERIAARCGLGAVMGSKNLKAIAVRGTLKPPLSVPQKFIALSRFIGRRLREKQMILSRDGTAMYVDRGMIANDMPVKYFKQAEMNVSQLNAGAMQRILVGRSACNSCPIGCGRVVSLPDTEPEAVAGPEFQTIAALGTNLIVSDIEHVSQMNTICNRLGLDTISCGNVLAFATQLTEEGIVDLGLSWGDVASYRRMIWDIGHRRGIGDVLAEGVRKVSQKYQVEDIALHVKGLEVPNHDPRAYFGLAAVYAVAARGASHTESDMHTIDIGIDVPSLGIHASDRVADDQKGVTAAKNQDFRAFHDSLIICHFPEITPNELTQLLNLATGSDYKIEDILKIGARIVNAKRLLNLRFGLTVDQDFLPQPLLESLSDSMTEGLVPDLERQIEEYYTYRGWDRTTGYPSKETLEVLGLDDV